MDTASDASSAPDDDRDRRREDIKRKLLARAQQMPEGKPTDPLPDSSPKTRPAPAEQAATGRRERRPRAQAAPAGAANSLAARARRSARTRAGDEAEPEPDSSTIEASPRPLKPASAKPPSRPRERAGLLIAGLGKLAVQLFAFHRPATWTLYSLLSLAWLVLFLVQPLPPVWAQAGAGALVWRALALQTPALSGVLLVLLGLLAMCGVGALIGGLIDGLRRRPVDLDLDAIVHHPSTRKLRIMRRRLGAEQEVKEILARAGFKKPQLKTVAAGIVGRVRKGSARALLRALAQLGFIGGIGLVLGWACLFGNAQLELVPDVQTALPGPLPVTLRQLWTGERAAFLRRLEGLVAENRNRLLQPESDLASLESSLRALDSAQVTMAEMLAERGATDAPVLAMLLRLGPDSVDAAAPELQLGLGRQLLTTARGTAASYRHLLKVKERLAHSFLPSPDPGWLLGPRASTAPPVSGPQAQQQSQFHHRLVQALRQLHWWLARQRGSLSAFARQLGADGAASLSLVHVEGSFDRKASLNYPRDDSPLAWRVALERYKRVFSDTTDLRWLLEPAPVAGTFEPQTYRAQIAYRPAGSAENVPDTLNLSSQQFVVRGGWLLAFENVQPAVDLDIDGTITRLPTGIPLEVPGLEGSFELRATPWAEVSGNEGPQVVLPTVLLFGEANGQPTVTPLQAATHIDFQGHELRAQPVFSLMVRAVALPPLSWLAGCFGVGFLFLWLWSVSSSADLYFAVVREVGRAELCLLLEGDGGTAKGRALLDAIRDIARRPQ